MKFTLSYPVTPVSFNQHFGDIANLAYYQANGINFVGHNGIDFKAYHGQPIYASHDGQAWYETDDKQGHGVVLVTMEQFEYKDSTAFFKTIYWHMVDSVKEPNFRSPVENYTDTSKPGMIIKRGDLLGYANSTGLSTGDHLHFGLKPMLLGYPGDYVNIEQNNGYFGAIDPQPYLPPPLVVLPISPTKPVETPKPPTPVIHPVVVPTPPQPIITPPVITPIKVKDTWLSTVIDYLLSFISRIIKS